MTIKIRQIDKGGRNFRFKPYSTGGYRFNYAQAAPSLSSLEIACIEANPSVDRKHGVFNSAGFCYVGAQLYYNGIIDLKKSTTQPCMKVIKKFNALFPKKEWAWYEIAQDNCVSMQIYFLGVRGVSAIISYYHWLKNTGQTDCANRLKNDFMTPMALHRINIKIDSKLIQDIDDRFNIVMVESECRLILTDDKLLAATEKGRNLAKRRDKRRSRKDKSKLASAIAIEAKGSKDASQPSALTDNEAQSSDGKPISQDMPLKATDTRQQQTITSPPSHPQSTDKDADAAATPRRKSRMTPFGTIK